HGLALVAQLSGELARCLHGHVAIGRRRFEQRDQLPHRRVDALLEQREQDLLLAGEVPVEGALRVPRLGGDFVHARLSVAPSCKHPQRRRQELVASLASLRARGPGAPIEPCSALSVRSLAFAECLRVTRGHRLVCYRLTGQYVWPVRHPWLARVPL